MSDLTVTPLARAVEAMVAVTLGPPPYRHGTAMIEAQQHDLLLAALDVLGPVIVERAREYGFRKGDPSPCIIKVYPDWPAIRASLTEREP